MANRFRKLIENKQLAIGYVSMMQDPAVIEIAAHSGFGFALLHAFSTQGARMSELIRAADAAQMPILVGIPGPNPSPELVAEVLDFGADGIDFALVETKEQAGRFVRMCKLAPLGDREAFPGGRLANYWGVSIEEFTRRANDCVVRVKIETKKALENVEERLSVPGIDIAEIGLSDLSRSLGVGRDHPLLAEAQIKLIQAAKNTGKTAVQLAMTAAEMGDWLKREPSLRLFRMGTDGIRIGVALRTLYQQCDEFAMKSANIHVQGVATHIPRPILSSVTPSSHIK